jgi:hypothetical protein
MPHNIAEIEHKKWADGSRAYNVVYALDKETTYIVKGIPIVLRFACGSLRHAKKLYSALNDCAWVEQV